MAHDRTVFLMYHELRSPGRALCRDDRSYTAYVIDADVFRAQLDLLRAGGFRGLSVGEALAGANASGPAVVLTFDDGCETDLLTAAPLLQEAGFRATFYVVAGFVGWPGYLNVAQLRELGRRGFEVGCHSQSHPFLTDLDEARLRVEVVEAKERLEQLAGRRVDHFSCPGGRWNGRVAEVARQAGYVSVATSRVGANGPTTDRFRLARVAVQPGLTLAGFERVCRGRLLKRQVRERLLAAAKGVFGNGLYEKLRSALLGRN
jgi:peptidoglycan/xylan/chitin deacetylase (PgdA/CDA1 family)